MTRCATLSAQQFTQTDPNPHGAGTAFEGSYVYGGSRPTLFADPSGRRAGLDLALMKNGNPVKTKGLVDIPGWLAKKAAGIVSAQWKTTAAAQTTGICGSVGVDSPGFSVEIQGCLVDDGSRFGSAEWFGYGDGAIGVGASVTGLMSNAKTIWDLGGPGVCVGISVVEVIGGMAEVCIGLTQSLTDPLKVRPSMLTSTALVSAGPAAGFGPAISGHVLVGDTGVKEYFGYPDWVGCSGRIIPNPVAAIKAAIAPTICLPSLPW